MFEEPTRVGLSAVTLGAQMADVVEATWVTFELIGPSDSGKTKIYEVLAKAAEAKEFEIVLGEIRWYGAWRKYAFFPMENTVYESDCLHDIAEFLKVLMKERK